MLIFYAFLIFGAQACSLAGQQIGSCISKQDLPQESFCQNWIEDKICAPLPSLVWNQYSTLKYRDSAVKDIFMFYVEHRMLSEYVTKNETLILSNNKKCYESYKKFICQFNFPACSSASATIPVCKSVCTAFFVDCISSADACDIIYSTIAPYLDSSC